MGRSYEDNAKVEVIAAKSPRGEVLQSSVSRGGAGEL